MLKTLLNGNSRKRKASEEPEVPRASTSSLSKHTAQTTINGPANQASDSDEEEDSRSKSISAKNKKKSDLFHNKPVKSRQNNASSATEPMPKKSKQQKESTATTGSGNTKEATPDTFAKPTIPTGSKKGNTSAPASPVRSTIGTTAKPALSPPFQAQLQNGRPREIDNSDDEDDASILTETTMTGTLMGSPQADDSEQRKKKRKKKKKKNRISQPPVEGGPQPNGSANTGMLFGNSILD